MKIISESTIRQLHITPRQCVEWIHQSFAAKDQAQLPAKISVHPTGSDFFTSMPCLLPPVFESDGKTVGHQYFGLKLVHRIEGTVPSLGSDMLLYEARSGQLLAMVDTDWITTMRTGAVAAVSAKALRKSAACSYGFVGLGNTARATLLCLLEQEPDTTFHVRLLRYKDHATDFIRRFRDYPNATFTIVDSMEQLAATSDVLFSCISNTDTLLLDNADAYPAGITIIPVHTKGFQNCDLVFDRVFGDDTDHVKGFRYFRQWRDYNEIGQVLNGNDPGRRSDEQRIIDYNYGIALHDVFFASRIYELLHDTDCPEVAITKETEKFWV